MRHTSFVCTALISIIVLAVASIGLSPTLYAKGNRVTVEMVAALEARLSALEDTVADLQATQGVLQHVRYETGLINGLAGPHMIIEGVNVHIRNSLATPGQTYGTASTGLGNLVIGWNEDSGGSITANDRLGSHNLIIGGDHKYTNSGCFLAGRHNTASGPASSVSGGRNNTASGDYASISGGGGGLPEYGNTASGNYASVSGGRNNTASSRSASVSAGWDNTASGLGQGCSVSGGKDNTASGWYTSVSGGQGNTASGSNTSVSGGFSRTASVVITGEPGVVWRISNPCPETFGC